MKGTPMSRRDRQLYRDTDDQKVGGVCSGLARYFNVDPLLVRIAFVALTLMAGGAIVAYLLLWWLADAAPAGYWAETSDRTPTEGFAAPAADTAIQPDADVAA